jgi:hypothetical protein
MRRLISVTLVLLSLSSAGLTEVKRGDPGATCTTSTETIQGQTAKCESCTATKCDTSGDTVTNCRKETTKTCTIGGRVVNPNNPRSGIFQKAPSGVLRQP